MKKINEKAAMRGNESGKAAKMSNSDKVTNEEKAQAMSIDKSARGGFEYFKRETAAAIQADKAARLADVKAEVLQAIEDADTTTAAALLRSCSPSEDEVQVITAAVLESACEYSQEFAAVVGKARSETDGLTLALVNVENTTSAETIEKVSDAGTLFYVDGHAWGKVPTSSAVRAVGSYLTFAEWQKDLAKSKAAKKRAAVDAAAAAVVTACKAAPLEMRETLLTSLALVYGDAAVNVARQRLALSAKVDEARAALLNS